MSKSSIDTFDPQGLMNREEPATSLKECERHGSVYKNTDSDDKTNDQLWNSKDCKPMLDRTPEQTKRSVTIMRNSIPIKKGYLRMMIMMDHTLSGS